MPVGGGSSIRAGRAYVELFADQSMLQRGLKAAETKLRRFGQKMTAAGRSLAMAGTAATAPFAISTATAMRFSDAILSVKAVTGATGAAFDELADKAKQLGRTTSFTASEVAGGMLSLARAGFSPNEINAAIGGMLDLARATGTDLAVASDIAATTLRTFGLEASDLTHVADVLVATANNSAQTVEDLGESLKYASPAAADLGMTLEDTTKALGVLANFGIRGSMAGTSLRRMAVAFADPKVQKNLSAIGVEVLNLQKNIRNPADILQELGKAMQGMGTGERLALARELFDLRAMGAALKLSGDLDASIQRLYTSIDTADGVAAKTAETMDSGLGGAWRMLKSAAEGLQIAIGEALTPTVTKFANTAQELTRRTTEWVMANQGLVLGFAAIGPAAITAGAGLIIAGNALGAIGTAAGLAFSTIQGGATLVASLFGPGGLVIAGLTAFGVAVAASSGSITEMKDMLSDLATTIRGTWDGVARAFEAGNVSLAIDIAGAGIRAALARIEREFVEWAEAIEKTWDFVFRIGPDIEQVKRTDRGTFVKLGKDVAGETLAAAIAKQTEAEAELKRLREQAFSEVQAADKEQRLESAKAKLAELNAAVRAQQAAEAAENEPTPTSTPLPASKGIDWKVATQRAGGWLGRQLGDLNQMLGEKAFDAMGNATVGGIEDPVAAAERGMTRAALSSEAAMRIGGIGQLSTMDRIAKAAETTAEAEVKSEGWLGDMLTMMRRGQLTFAGNLPG